MKSEQCIVKVTVGDKEFSQTYTKKIAEKAEDILEMLSDEKQVKDVIRGWNYGSDLFAKTQVRNEILNKVAGPEKSQDKLVKDLVKMYTAMGKTLTEEAARVMVKGMINPETSADENATA